MKLKDLPPLEGWMTLPDAARDIGITRSRIHQLLGKNRFETARRIGTFAVVRTAEVEKYKKNKKLLAELLAEDDEQEGAA